MNCTAAKLLKDPRDVMERAALEEFIAQERYGLSLGDWQSLTGTLTFGSGAIKQELDDSVRQSQVLRTKAGLFLWCKCKRQSLECRRRWCGWRWSIGQSELPFRLRGAKKSFQIRNLPANWMRSTCNRSSNPSGLETRRTCVR
ncbi:MAG: hypothetical protein HY298_21840 [Verrucomicrobia bacterium]|nr:hypothetical protein [Verrucomicrobiota bacterium]